jgi:hypothetical protein
MLLNEILDEVGYNQLHPLPVQFESTARPGIQTIGFYKSTKNGMGSRCNTVPPPSKGGFTAILLAVHMFTGFIQLCPIKSRATEDLQQAVLQIIIRPFGAPKLLGTEQECN